MEKGELQDMETILAQVKDPRVERTKRYRLRDIIIIAMCGVICGVDGWVEIEECGKAKQAWFTDLLIPPMGSPRMTLLDGSLRTLIPNNLKRVFSSRSRVSAKRFKG